MELVLIADLPVKLIHFFFFLVGKMEDYQWRTGPIWFGSLGKFSNKSVGRRDTLIKEVEEYNEQIFLGGNI